MILGLLEFDDAPGLRLVNNIIECDPKDVYFGMPVEVVFHRINEEVTLPLFKPIRK